MWGAPLYITANPSASTKITLESPASIQSQQHRPLMRRARELSLSSMLACSTVEHIMYTMLRTFQTIGLGRAGRRKKVDATLAASLLCRPW